MAGLDAVLVVVTFVGVLALVDRKADADLMPMLAIVTAIAIGVHVTANSMNGLYGHVWRQAGVQEARGLVCAAATAVPALLLITLALPGRLGVPAQTVVLGSLLAIGLCGAVRFQSRLFAFRRRADEADTTRLVLIGAGNAGGAVVREMLDDPGLGLRPVAILDESPRLWGREVAGVPIIGGLSRLADAKIEYGAEQALLAIPSASSAEVSEAFEATHAAGLVLRVLPSVPELVGGAVSARDVRDLSITDLLGRQQVSTDLAAVAGILAGRRVLITGAGGSIGSEIARQVASFAPAALMLLDNDETHLYDVASELAYPTEQVLADIRDGTWIHRLVAGLQPDVIFHAAAHKHVPLLESHPCEAILTNVLGTESLLKAAVDAGTERFVFISTDKSVRPSSVMGATKHVGEQLLLSRRPPNSAYCAVRFGNVLGSRGSVIPTFVRQIQRGGPVTVTDPDVTRFFMSIPEAVQLVLQAAALSEGGEVFMLDMGEPMKIVDLAKRMIHLSGRAVGSEVPIEFTGLRPGEKLAEMLLSPEERTTPTEHPAIMAVTPVQAGAAIVDRGVRSLAEHARAHRPGSAVEALFCLVNGEEARGVSEGRARETVTAARAMAPGTATRSASVTSPTPGG